MTTHSLRSFVVSFARYAGVRCSAPRSVIGAPGARHVRGYASITRSHAPMTCAKRTNDAPTAHLTRAQRAPDAPKAHLTAVPCAGSIPIRILVTLLALCLAAGTALFFHRMFPPEMVEKAAAPASDYDSAAMLAAMNPTNVQQEMEQILALGSRFMGQPGAYKLEELIRKRYTAAGLEVLEQENTCAAPRTHRRDILSATGQPLPGVDSYPFMPCSR